MKTPNAAITALVCLCAGALMVPGQAPWHLWPLFFAGLSAFYYFLNQTKTKKSAFLYGWSFGFGYYAAGFWWIANALLVDGNEFRWVWPFAIAGLPALLAFYPALCALLVKRFYNLQTLPGFFGFVALMSAFEWLRGHLFTGFPWNLYGYIWSGWPAMMQSVSLGGAYFLTLLTVFWAALPGFLLLGTKQSKQKTALLITGLSLFALNAAYGYWRLGQNPTQYHQSVNVRLVQANISQEDKWNPAKTGENLRLMTKLSLAEEKQGKEDVTFIVWPETAISDNLLAHEKARALIKDALASYEGTVYLLTGIVRSDQDENGEVRYYNSLAALDRDLNVTALYNKSHLVPFGEYIPLEKILPLSPFVQMDGFTPGQGPIAFSAGSGPAFSPLVCYEVIFPGAITPKDRALRPAWIVNVTNDAWYGDSPGPRQHFEQARFRAIEEGLPVVRVANTGISGVIDPLGRTIYRAELSQMDGKTIKLPLPIESPTVFKNKGKLLFSLLLIALIVISRKHSASPDS